MDKRVNVITLPSGLTILFIPMPNTHTVNIELTIRAGGLDETKQSLGLFHLLEHMMAMFCSPSHPNASANQKELEQEGIISNAWTSEHTSGYWMKGEKKVLQMMLDFMIDNFVEPVINLKVFAKEKHAVKRELTVFLEDPWHPLENKIHKILFPNTTIALSVEEEIKNVENSEPKDIMELRRTYYKPALTLMTISGDFNKKTILKYIINRFAHFPEEKPNIHCKKSLYDKKQILTLSFMYLRTKQDRGL